MKISFSSVVFGLNLLVNTVTANTPDLCTEDIKKLYKLKPSECDPTGRVGPDITVGSTVYVNDEPHFVIGSPKYAKKNGVTGTAAGRVGPILNLYLPGTTDWPALSSCLIQSIAATGNPTIGLTFGYLSRGDSFRNTRCASLTALADQVECLTQQHEDAIFGGTYGAERTYNDALFWQSVDPRDSIQGRLGLLLKKLDTDFPNQGWGKYYYFKNAKYPLTPLPKWRKIAISGHSQGAGHAAYLAQKFELPGAVMISGPQDECIDCPEGTSFWIDNPYNTKAVTAFAHGDASQSFLEPSLPGMIDNWNRMAKTETLSWTYPVEVVDTGSYTTYDVCKTPITSFLAPSAMSPCGRKGHCSTALDDSAPTLNNTMGESVYVFALDIWTNVADVAKCNGL